MAENDTRDSTTSSDENASLLGAAARAVAVALATGFVVSCGYAAYNYMFAREPATVEEDIIHDE